MKYLCLMRIKLHINKQEIEDLKRDMRQLLKVSQSILAENASLKRELVH